MGTEAIWESSGEIEYLHEASAGKKSSMGFEAPIRIKALTPMSVRPKPKVPGQFGGQQ